MAAFLTLIWSRSGKKMKEEKFLYPPLASLPTLENVPSCLSTFLLNPPEVLSLSHGGQESGEVMWRSQQIVNQAGVRGGSQPQHGRPGGPCTPEPDLRCPHHARPSIPRPCRRTPPQPRLALPDCRLPAAGEDVSTVALLSLPLPLCASAQLELFQSFLNV